MPKIKIAVPGLWEHFQLIKNTVQFIETNPAAARPNVSIGAVYGNFQYCIWDGGRIFPNFNFASFEDIVEIKDYFKETQNNLFNISYDLAEKYYNDFQVYQSFNNYIQSADNDINNKLESMYKKLNDKYNNKVEISNNALIEDGWLDGGAFEFKNSSNCAVNYDRINHNRADGFDKTGVTVEFTKQ